MTRGAKRWRLRLRSRHRANTGTAQWELADREWAEIDWTPYIRGASVHGRHVRYVDVGTGRPVVLVHGQGGAWQWWLRVIPALARQARVIALDLAGFGASDPVAAGDVFEEQVATIIGLLDELRLARATIVGHSMGGLVSLKVACDHPSRVEGLMLIDSGSNIMGPARLRAILLGFRLFDWVFSFSVVPRLIARWRYLRAVFFALAVAKPRCITRSLANELVPRMAAPGFIAGMEAAGKAVSEATPEAVSAPALVVWGRGDRIVPLSSGSQLADAIPHARLVVLDDVAHCAMIEKPAETAALIADFVRDPMADRAATDFATDARGGSIGQPAVEIPKWESASGGEKSG
jgi:pimeloyl-ACP methyl ester carboxylesterase